MASPQIENGHIDIANEIAEAFAGCRISGEEWQVLWVILRKTYGWHKKEDAISLSQFCLLSKMVKPHVNRAIKNLLSKKVICVTSIGNRLIPNSYRFNKNYDEWVSLPKKVTVPKSITNIDNRLLPILDPTKEKVTKEKRKEIYKEKSKFGKDGIVLLTDEQYQELIKKFGMDGAQDKIEILGEGILSKGYKYKSHYHAILSWSRREQKQSHVVKELPLL